MERQSSISNVSAEATPSSTRKKRVIACAACRQSKIRCDASSVPCGRCQRLGLKCERDKGYRRLAQRSVGVPNSHPQQSTNGSGSLVLRSSLESLQIDGSPRHPSMVQGMKPLLPRDDSTTIDSEASSQKDIGSEGTSNSCHSSVRPDPTHSSWSLGEVSFTSKEIQELFEIYFAHYHQWMPILRDDLAFTDFWNYSELLFWCIVVTACRTHSAYKEFLKPLSESISQILWTKVSHPPLPTPDIKAFLVICTWPLPFTKFWTEPTSVLLNTAIFSAFALGIHRLTLDNNSEAISDPERAATTLQHIRIWAALNITAQNLSENFGHPPALQLVNNNSVLKICRGRFDIPSNLRHSLLIARHSNKITNMMSGNEDDDLGLPPPLEISTMISELDTELMKEASEIEDISPINLIRLMVARLQLHIYHLFTPSATPGREQGLIKAHSIAAEIVTTITSSQYWYDLLAYAPTHFLRSSLFIPAMLFNKLVHSSLISSSANASISPTAQSHLSVSFPVIDTSLSTVLFQGALFALRRAAVLPADFSGRGAVMLEHVWNHCKDDEKLKSSSPRLLVKTRMGTGLVYDCLWMWYRTRGVNIPIKTWDAQPQEGSNIAILLNVDENQEHGDENINEQHDFPWVDWIWDEEMEQLLRSDNIYL